MSTVTGTLAATAVTGDGSGLTSLTGASAGTYGASTITPIITVDSNGRITGIATVATAGAGGGGGISNIVEDTTPQLGGNLDLNSKIINGSGNLDYTGNLKSLVSLQLLVLLDSVVMSHYQIMQKFKLVMQLVEI